MRNLFSVIIPALACVAIVSATLVVTPARAQGLDAGFAFASEPAAAPAPGGEGNKETSVYDEWARRLLDKEKRVTDKPHPLALQYPDHFVVVCEGGCAAEREMIVYMERQDARGPVNGPEADLPEIPPEAARNVISCVGGCYLGEKNFAAANSAFAADPENDWVTTSAPTARQGRASPADTSGQWHDRMAPGQ